MTRGANPYYSYDGRSEDVLKMLDRERFTAMEAEWLGHRFVCRLRGPACEISRFTCLLSYRIASIAHPPNHLVMCLECEKGKTLDGKFHKRFENASKKKSCGGNDSPHTPPNFKHLRGPGGNHSPQMESS